MKKFYKLVSTKKTDDGFAIQLDGKTIKTPSGQELVAPSQALAEAIAAEWGAQEERIIPDTMPLMQVLTTAIDRQRDREAMTAALMRYLDTDLICYQVKEPEILKNKQLELWEPYLKWFDEHFEIPLDTTYGIEAIKQDEEAHSRVWNYLEGLDEYYFAALHIITASAGSIVLGLAFIEGEATPQQVFDASWLEETYHAELANEAEYGEDPVVARKQAAMKTELDAVRRFLDLIDAD